MQIHVGRGSEQYGSYSLEEVNAFLADGTLLSTDEAWQDGTTDWVPIGQIPRVVKPVDSAGPPPRPVSNAGPACPVPSSFGGESGFLHGMRCKPSNRPG